MNSKTNLDQNTASFTKLRSSSKSKSIGGDLTKTDSLDELGPEQSTQASVDKMRSKKIWKDPSEESSHTKFYKRPTRLAEFEQVTRDEYFSISESMSGSSDTYNCIHGPEGKQYTQKGLLKRNILKNLDPIPFDHKWTDDCTSTFDWDIAKMLEMMVESPTVDHQMDRLILHLRDFVKTSRNGYRVDTLKSYCVIMEFLLQSEYLYPELRKETMQLLKNLQKPILLMQATDVLTYFEAIMHFMGFIAYLLIRLDEEEQFDIAAKAMIFHLSAPDHMRGQGTVSLRRTLTAAAPVLRDTIVRMCAVADQHRFPIFLDIVLLLACDTVENCIEMMKENIIEIIFYRFNPYFPEKGLPHYDINPHDCQDMNVNLGLDLRAVILQYYVMAGESSKNMTTTLSLLLVLLKTTTKYLEENPGFKRMLPVPDTYAQRCFIWAYRYECRAREHRHQRITLTVIAHIMIKCFGDHLLLFSAILMPDIMSLSVLTELPTRSDWLATVNFTTSQQDVQFKKTLIYFVVDLLKAFPYNKFMVEARYWLMGIMYLLDPGLCTLRSRWSTSLFGEIRKTALQALVCTLPRCDPKLVKKYGLIRRVMWYIEWYSESPFEIPVLYWCVRVLHVAIHHSRDPERKTSMQDLFDTHGIIIIINLCYTLMEQKIPPVEKSQAIIALSLRLLTSAVVKRERITCIVYPTILWPVSSVNLARKMMDVVLYSLDKHFIISDRWAISLLNFVWEAIIWNTDYREQFVADNGVYKLLDMITMTRAPVQCIALALVCDIASAGNAVGHLVTWRAAIGAATANPKVVRPGATIVTLLAALFREECLASKVQLDENGVIQDLEFPIMSLDGRNELFNTDSNRNLGVRTPVCLAASSLAGSCMSKAFAILQMLSEDLQYKVALADEAYNLYKNIQLAMKDEAILVLCSHYLTLKLNEVWKETEIQTVPLFVRDKAILEDFIEVGKGWAKEIKRQQEVVVATDRKKQHEEESSLYAFLARIRLNIALDGLRYVRCVARSTDHDRIRNGLLNDAVFAHHRRSVFADKTNATFLRTYKPPLDDQNITGQNIKVMSIQATTIQEPCIPVEEDLALGCGCGCNEQKDYPKENLSIRKSRDIMRPIH